jgi:hypothetical protein
VQCDTILAPAATQEPVMRTFVMQFEDDGMGEPKRIEFRGKDPSQALAIAQRENTGRMIALFEGGKKLGTLRRINAELWQVG